MTQAQIQPVGASLAGQPPASAPIGEPGSLHALVLQSLDDDQA